MILNVLRTDISVTSMMARSYAEFAAQSALVGRDAPRLLALGARRLEQLRAQLDSVPCIRYAPGKLDVDALDLEVAHVAIRTQSKLPQNEATAGTSLMILQEALHAHSIYLRKLFQSGGAKVAAQVFAPGRVVVLGELEVPSSLSSDVENSSAAKITCFHVPAVVLETQVRNGHGGNVVVVIPPCYTRTNSAATSAVKH